MVDNGSELGIGSDHDDVLEDLDEDLVGEDGELRTSREDGSRDDIDRHIVSIGVGEALKFADAWDFELRKRGLKN